MKLRYAFLKNAHGMSLQVAEQGGTAISLMAPDRKGQMGDVILGVSDPEFLGRDYLGQLIGRVGNRIANGTFTLDGVEYKIPLNNGPRGEAPVCALHGGPDGFNSRKWKMREFEAPEGPALEMTLLSPDGDQGFPGNLAVRVVYTLTNTNVWRIEYWALTDRATPVSLTNHAYFNLTGDSTKSVMGHEAQIFASAITESDPYLVPNGKLVDVEKTPFDFRTPHTFGERIDADEANLKNGKGYDHNFVLDREGAARGELARCAVVKDPESGRVMECWTTLPCVQLYTANGLGVYEPFPLKNGVTTTARTGFCLETQFAPNAVNIPAFESAILRPGELWHHVTEYRFSVD